MNNDTTAGDLIPYMVRRCADGTIPANVALMQLMVRTTDAHALELALDTALNELAARNEPGVKRAAAMLELMRNSPSSWATVKSVWDEVALESAGRAVSPTPSTWALLFDRVANISPEAGAALYTLGRSDLLEAATASIVGRLREWGLLGHDRKIVDLGCGAGRLCAALAPHVREVIGIDVSASMLAAAHARCSDLRNVRLCQTHGDGLAAIPTGSIDLVLAVDVFPYLVDCGTDIVSLHFKEAARVLKAERQLVIANFSYRGDVTTDAADVQHFADEAGLTLVRQGCGDFDLWDGITFELKRV